MQVPLLVNDFLRRAADLYPDKLAIVDGERRYTYRDFRARANQLSRALTGLGIQKGDRVCILSPNSHFFLESFYGTSQIGAILVPLNYRLVAADHEYILNHAGVKAVLVDWEYTALVDEIRDNLGSVEHWIEARDEGPASEGWTSWNELLADSSAEAFAPLPLDENELVSINYTSGTTARPKGVMLTHRNCYLNAYNLIAHLGIQHPDVELWTLPMFHCNGWGGVYALTGMGGTHVVLRAVEGRRVFELIEQEGVTFACMAPAVLRTILDYPDKDDHTIVQPLRFTVAGAPPPAAFIERLRRHCQSGRAIRRSRVWSASAGSTKWGRYETSPSGITGHPLSRTATAERFNAAPVSRPAAAITTRLETDKSRRRGASSRQRCRAGLAAATAPSAARLPRA